MTIDHVHKLKSVIEREKALTGILVTLNPATRVMLSEAAAAGFAETVFGRIPKIQIATIEDLLNYRMPGLPAIDASAFKKAPKEKSERQAGFDF